MEPNSKTDTGLGDGISIDPTTGKTKVTLKYPFDIGTENITEVSLRRPTGRDLAAMDEAGDGENKRAMILISSLCDVPPNYAFKMDAVDIGRLTNIIAGFMDTSPQTGGT